ncbi:nucleotidyltransferase family protein [Shimia sp. R9_3]|uniref:nucleotidyltransferase family protein n=1 Tax=Shimia sp. R9_3 TaxID=2821113 RepID=UPI001ADCCD4E|nr:nucleotidyltransferase family protein [Shimia sp. R9_3]MBO9401438.1 nucleotidyltransferase family protein [Shimia sp. R9_3]
MISILILAAGSSSRMRGGDKLLEEVEGAPLLRTLALRAMKTGAEVLVALPTDRRQRRDALDGLNVAIVEVSDAHEGMAHSLRGGIAALPEKTSAVMILPADMPELTAEDFQTLTAAHQDDPKAILRGATSTDKPGHPVLFPSRFFEDLRKLSGDVGARDILKANHDVVKLIPLPGDHALIDLDTPEQWENWRAAQDQTQAAPQS